MHNIQVKDLSATIIFLVATIFLAEISMAEWQNTGPDGTQVNSMVADFSKPSTLYVGTKGGVYKSTDAGLTWSYKTLRFQGATGINLAPGCSPQLTASSGWGLVYGSTDGGENWSEFAAYTGNPILVIATSSSCIRYYGTSNGVYGSNSSHGLSGIAINSLAIDSANTIYATSEEAKIYKSIDNGTTWTPITPTLTTEFFAWKVIAVSADHIFATTFPSGVLWSEDGGNTWSQRVNGLPDLGGDYAATAIAKGNSTLYAGIIKSVRPMSSAVYKSVDNGLNWTPTNSAASKEYEISDITVPTDNNVFLGTNLGVLRSGNGGTSWTDLSSGFKAVAINHSMVENGNGTLFVGSNGGGVYRSTNGGVTWTQAGSGAPAYAEALLVDDTDVLFCTDEGLGGVYKSIDNGANWNLSSTGLPTEVAGSLTFYDRVYSLAQGGNGRIYAGLRDGVVYYSDNQGVSWTIAAPLPGATSGVRSIVAGAGGLVYAGTEGNGFYKSNDGGASWSPKNNGLPTNANVIQNGILLDSTTGDLFLPLWWPSEGLYHSTDGGENWVAVSVPQVCSNHSNAITMDSLQNLYAVFCQGAVYKSIDRGNTWTDMSDGLGTMDNIDGINIQGIYANRQNTLLLSTMSNGIYRRSAVAFPWPMFMPAITAGSLR
jgi:photosystem II stability/assembly factor-like uncharacterized protein